MLVDEVCDVDDTVVDDAVLVLVVDENVVVVDVVTVRDV